MMTRVVFLTFAGSFVYAISSGISFAAISFAISEDGGVRPRESVTEAA